MTNTLSRLLGTGAALAISASAAMADQVFLDDVIIDGSLCVGIDCVNGESFGFDTIRMKENNLRLAAVDTSTTASFPTNDWQLTFNDSSNGGQNKFSIDDVTGGRTPFTIEASAPTHSLYVDDGGRIGVGTGTPVVEVHVVDGDTPTLRLEQDGSSGFTPQTWDVAGNETNFFVRDVTNGSRLPFKIKPSAPTNSIYVDTDGDVGMNDTSPDASLHVRRASGGLLDMMKLENTGDVAMIFANTAAGAATPEWKTASFNGNYFIGTPTSPGAEFLLSNTGNLTITGTLTTGSSTVYPDYVFEDDYSLMPLAELDAYIDANGHLPKIPKAEEVAKTGINISEMQVALLEKVEELTLYTLQQEKQIQALKQQLAD